jgi:hypothetical protein
MMNIFKGLFKGHEVSLTEHLQLRAELQSLKIQNEEYKRRLLFQQTTHHEVPISGFDDLRTAPVEPKKRAQYIADVTIFFDNILHRKLKTSIAEVRSLLSNIGRQEGTPLSMPRNEYDMFLRGMEAAFWKMHDWAKSLEAETQQGLQDKENDYGGIR